MQGRGEGYCRGAEIAIGTPNPARCAVVCEGSPDAGTGRQQMCFSVTTSGLPGYPEGSGDRMAIAYSRSTSQLVVPNPLIYALVLTCD
jgi:hypothetical protein